MKRNYICEICGTQFEHEEDCRWHERLHLQKANAIISLYCDAEINKNINHNNLREYLLHNLKEILLEKQRLSCDSLKFIENLYEMFEEKC